MNKMNNNYINNKLCNFKYCSRDFHILKITKKILLTHTNNT